MINMINMMNNKKNRIFSQPVWALRTTHLPIILGILFTMIAGCTPETKDEDFTLTRDKYVGKWFCQDSDGASYNATITSDPSNSSQVIINNYFKLEGNVTALVTETTITVSNQKMQGISGNFWCEGRGLLSKKNGIYTIYWELYTNGDDNIKITSTYTKQ